MREPTSAQDAFAQAAALGFGSVACELDGDGNLRVVARFDEASRSMLWVVDGAGEILAMRDRSDFEFEGAI